MNPMDERARAAVLSWLERLLLAGGLVLGTWSGLTFLEARYVARMEPPPPARALPGEAAPGSAIGATSPPGTGEWVAWHAACPCQGWAAGHRARVPLVHPW